MVPTAFNAALFSSLKGVAVGTFVFLTICESREVGVKNIIRYTLHSCDNCRLDAGVYNDGLLAALKDMVFLPLHYSNWTCVAYRWVSRGSYTKYVDFYIEVLRLILFCQCDIDTIALGREDIWRGKALTLATSCRRKTCMYVCIVVNYVVDVLCACCLWF